MQKQTEKSGVKLEKHELIKHSAAIHISNDLTRLQRITSNILLKNALKESSKKDIYSISISDLCDAIGFSSRNLEPVKEAIAVLNTTQLQWNIFGKDRKNSWGVTTILAAAEIVDGVCSYSYSPLMRRLLDRPNIYARLNLLVQKELKNKHGLAIWEFLVEVLCTNKFQAGWTDWILINDFKKLLGVHTDPLYTEFKYINQRIIKGALPEINRVSDINAMVEYKKKGRKVESIRFYIERKSDYQMPVDIALPQSITDYEQPKEIIKLNGVKKELFKRLLKHGLKETQALAFLMQFESDYIGENLDYVEKESISGNVQNVAAYTVAAIQDDYRQKLTQLELEQKSAEEIIKEQEMARQRLEKLISLQKEFAHDALESSLNNLSKKEKIKLEKQFVKYMEENSVLNYLIINYKEYGLDHFTVKGSFLNYAKEQLRTSRPSMVSFKEYLQDKGFNINHYREELKLIKF